MIPLVLFTLSNSRLPGGAPVEGSSLFFEATSGGIKLIGMASIGFAREFEASLKEGLGLFRIEGFMTTCDSRSSVDGGGSKKFVIV